VSHLVLAICQLRQVVEGGAQICPARLQVDDQGIHEEIANRVRQTDAEFR